MRCRNRITRCHVAFACLGYSAASPSLQEHQQILILVPREVRLKASLSSLRKLASSSFSSSSLRLLLVNLCLVTCSFRPRSLLFIASQVLFRFAPLHLHPDPWCAVPQYDFNADSHHRPTLPSRITSSEAIPSSYGSYTKKMYQSREVWYCSILPW